MSTLLIGAVLLRVSTGCGCFPDWWAILYWNARDDDWFAYTGKL